MKLESEDIFFLNELDQATGVIARDCIVSKPVVTFLVKHDDMGKAIGSGGTKIKQLTQKLGRKVELVAFFDDPKEFFVKALPDVEVTSLKKEGEFLVLKMNSTEKRKIMAQPAKFKRIKKLAERNYSIDGVKLK